MPGSESGYLLTVQPWESYLMSQSLHICRWFDERNPYVIGLLGEFSRVRYTCPEDVTGNTVNADY